MGTDQHVASHIDQRSNDRRTEVVGSRKKSGQFPDCRSQKIIYVIGQRTRNLADHILQERHEIACGPPGMILPRVRLDNLNSF